MTVKAILSRSALKHNVLVVRKHCPSQKIWAMVKANAYGHGLEDTVDALSGVDAFGVACLDEALCVRAIEPEKPVYVMRGFLNNEELQMMLSQNIGSVLHCWDQICCLSSEATSLRHCEERSDEATHLPPLATWIKIDTGMHRLGFETCDIPRLQEVLPALPIQIEGWMTHLAKADDADSTMTQQQLGTFSQCLSPDDTMRSMANSAAILAHPVSHGDWVRPGLMLYGVSPFAGKAAADLDLKPVMTVTAPVLAIKNIPAGKGVGYGQAWTATQETPVATIGMGYGDGYPREAVDAFVSIGGVRCPVVGRVSMDMMAVDLSPLKGRLPVVGAQACIWGQENPIEQLAQAADTIPYTLLTRITKRVQFFWEH